MSKNFVLIGAGGYVAPRHLEAIRKTGNNLLAALDKHDSVGILDTYFPEADFFTEFERFDRHCEKLRRSGTPIHYVSVCSPNYLHDAHCRFGLRIGADVICEKPVVLNPWNVDALIEMEAETGKNIYSVLQLRYHPSVIALKERIEKDRTGHLYRVELQFITPRGKWYHYSWKGDTDKSGGLVSNIGVHFFDMLLWIFGDVKESIVLRQDPVHAEGKLLLERAEVKWMLSIDGKSLPPGDNKPFRSLKIDEELLDLSSDGLDLHRMVYEEIIGGRGIRLNQSKDLIGLLTELRKGQTK